MLVRTPRMPGELLGRVGSGAERTNRSKGRGKPEAIGVGGWGCVQLSTVYMLSTSTVFLLFLSTYDFAGLLVREALAAYSNSALSFGVDAHPRNPWNSST